MSHNIFTDFLAKHGIGGISPHITSDLLFHLDAPPEYYKIVPIPLMEQFPLIYLERTNPHPNESELRRHFVESQLENIRNKIDISEDSINTVISAGPIIELEADFESIEEFVMYKKAVAVEYRRKSYALGMDEPINICAEPICLNPAVLGYEYCTYHLPKDTQFEFQPFLIKCPEDKCETPCSPSVGGCMLHREPTKRKSRLP